MGEKQLWRAGIERPWDELDTKFYKKLKKISEDQSEILKNCQKATSDLSLKKEIEKKLKKEKKNLFDIKMTLKHKKVYVR